MASFTVVHCRRIDKERSEFDIRPLSGEVREGDMFSFRGVYNTKKFKVLSIQHTPTHDTLSCEGTLDFDDEITRAAITTKMSLAPPADLPVPANAPIPTAEEEQWLNWIIEDWETRAPVQRAICLLIYRGTNTPDQIATELGITDKDVLAAMGTVWGILYDGSKKEFLFK